MKINKLKWDSEFFGFQVAEIMGEEKDENLLLNIKNKLSSENIDLAYYRSDRILPENSDDNFYFQYVLKRLPLYKEVKIHNLFHPNISVYSQDTVDPDLIRLAQLAGRMGRFGRDPNITTQQCDKIFENLIINSVNKKLASEVLVYREEGKIIGFCSIKRMGEEAYIPLIAVLPEFEGKGAAFHLMSAVETFLFDSECKVAIGGTQDFNKHAIKAFVRFGLKIGEPEYVYHIWKKDLIKLKNE